MEPTEAQGSWGGLQTESSQGPRLLPQGDANTACLCSSIQLPCLFLTPHPQAKSGKQLSADGVYGTPTVSTGMGPRNRNKLHTWPWTCSGLLCGLLFCLERWFHLHSPEIGACSSFSLW